MSAYQFPDEKGTDDKKVDEKIEFEVEGEGVVDIEVVDDTPEADRNREPLKEPPTEVTDDELEKYSESVRSRIKHFSRGFHDERRAKEAALREREEALRLAQKLVEENKKLQGSLGQGQQALVEQAKKVAATEIEQAKAKLRTAHEAGDTEAFIVAQEELTAAKIKADRLNSFKPQAAPQTPSQEDKPALQSSAQPPLAEPRVAAPDPKATAWQQANPWFGSDRRMTAVAMEVHNELVRLGMDTGSDEYYARINTEMRQVFPGAFTQEKRTAKPNVVTPSTRSTAPKKVVLTQTQVTLAKRLGLTNEQYARAYAAELRKQNV
jgi:hypothetical protein